MKRTYLAWKRTALSILLILALLLTVIVPVGAEIEEENNEGSLAMTLTAAVDDVEVVLTAPEGAFPKGTLLTARKVGQEYIDAVENALEEEGLTLEDAVAIDVTPVDSDGKEVQPQKEVEVSFRNTGLSHGEETEVGVYYVSDDASVVEQMSTSTATPEEQTFTTDHFTIFVANTNDWKTNTEQDPNGDGTNRQNSESNPFILTPNATRTFRATNDNISIYWATNSSYVSLSHVTSQYLNIKNNNKTTEDQPVRIQHGRDGDVEYYWILAKASRHSVTFKLKDAGAAAFAQMSGSPITVDWEQPVTEPEMQNQKTVNGVQYTFDGWYTSEGCTERADLSRITSNMKVYGKYDPTGYDVVYELDDPSSGQSGFREVKRETVAPGDATAPPSYGAKTAGGKTYLFRGWYADEACEEGAEVGEDAFSNIREPKTFYAKYELARYEVTYMHKAAGEGDFAPDDPAGESIESGSRPENVPAHDDQKTIGETTYYFDGWYTNEACTQPIELDSDPITESMTVYSRYVAEVTLTYNENAPEGAEKIASAHEPVTGKTGEQIRLPDDEPRFVGHHLAAWTTQSDGGGTSYAPGAVIRFPEQDTTLYAQWSAGTVKVTYKRNWTAEDEEGAFGEDSTDTVPWNYTHYNIRTGIPRRSGYIFMGWNTERSHDPSCYPGDPYEGIGEENITLYAVWGIYDESMLQTKQLTGFGGEIYYDGREHNMFKPVTDEDGDSGIIGVQETDNPQTHGEYKYADYVRVGRYTAGEHHHNLYAHVGDDPFHVTGKDAGTYEVPDYAVLYTHNDETDRMESVDGEGGEHDVIKVENNVLTIKQLPIRIRTASDEVACGSPRPQLTAGGWIQVGDGDEIQFTSIGKEVELVTGEKVTIRTTGSIPTTREGSVTNTYEIVWGDVKESNYKITEDLGTLTIYQNKANFDGNAGEDETLKGMPDPARDIRVNGESYRLPNEEPTRDHFDFTGWNTDIHGEGEALAPGDTYIFRGGVREVTFYAQWEPTEYTLTYDPNGGEFNGSADPYEEQHVHETIGITDKEPTRVHYSFTGWKDEKDVIYKAGDDYEVTKHMTFTAQWEKTDHVWNEGTVTTEPTCEEKGVRTYTCTIAGCGETKTEDIDALGHDWGEPTYEWNEDDTEVTATRVCGRDETHTETETAAVKKEVTKDPTCEEKGETTYTSEAFENEAFVVQTKTLEDVDALAHDWGEWTVTKEPTTTEEGEETRVCARCSEKETRVIPKLDPEKVEYRNTAGDGNIWTKGSGVTSDFVFKRSAEDSLAFDHFTGILVDGEAVDAANYTAESGSVLIKLQPAYLETLVLGEHTLTALFDDGNDPTADFTIIQKDEPKPDEKPDEKPDKKPDEKPDKIQPNNTKPGNKKAAKTGDTGHMTLWIGLLSASAVMISGILATKRKKRR